MGEDNEWVSQVLTGNVDAYTHLVNKYKDKVYAIVFRLVRQAEDARDITQDCFIRAFQSLKTFDRTLKFSSWLYRIAIHLCYDNQRFNQQRQKQVDADRVILAGSIDPEWHYLKKEMASELHVLINKLSEANRIVLLLRYVDDLTYQEIGEVLDLPVSTVQVRLYRAKQKLRSFISLENKGGDMYEVL